LLSNNVPDAIISHVISVDAQTATYRNMNISFITIMFYFLPTLLWLK